MSIAEYNEKMEASGASKVWVVEAGNPYSGNIYSRLFTTEPEAQDAFNAIPDNWYRNKYRTWDIWGWTERHCAEGVIQK